MLINVEIKSSTTTSQNFRLKDNASKNTYTKNLVKLIKTYYLSA